jgi:hypothetical protein
MYLHTPLVLRGMKRNARCTKEVFLSSHKNNVIFLWLVTPQFCYAILFRAVKEAILENVNKNFKSIFYKCHEVKSMLIFKKS